MKKREQDYFEPMRKETRNSFDKMNELNTNMHGIGIVEQASGGEIEKDNRIKAHPGANQDQSEEVIGPIFPSNWTGKEKVEWRKEHAGKDDKTEYSQSDKDKRIKQLEEELQAFKREKKIAKRCPGMPRKIKNGYEATG